MLITRFDDLLAAIGSLPPPADGRIRVFRGQNRAYPKMTPTASRTGGYENMIWPKYTWRVARDMAEHADVKADTETWLLWVRAIKQHYGPGTEFLDVTHSPGIAAWFALHEMTHETVRKEYALDGKYDPTKDVVGLHSFARYSPSAEPGYLYAIDAGPSPKYDRKHGALFDLKRAPGSFSTSARIHAQQGCLVFSDLNIDGGDLASLVVPGTPLQIGWPLDGCAETRWSTNQMFPTPDEDAWYSRFVTLPLAPDLEASKTETVYRHPINVTLYLPQASPDADFGARESLLERFALRDPPLLYPMLAASGLFLWRDLPRATPILLEGPLLAYPFPLEETNLPLLMQGLTRTAPAADYISGENLGEVSLENVFLEISALDEPNWSGLAAERPAVGVIRGIWLVRTGHYFTLTMCVYDFATGDNWTLGPVEILFENGAFLGRSTVVGSKWKPTTELSDLEPNFSCALAFVRALSPSWKVGATPFMIEKTEDGHATSSTFIEWAHGEIVSLRNLGGPIQLYNVVRRWGLDEPFYGSPELDSPSVAGVIPYEGRLSELSTDEILKQAQAVFAERTPAHQALPTWGQLRARFR